MINPFEKIWFHKWQNFSMLNCKFISCSTNPQKKIQIHSTKLIPLSSPEVRRLYRDLIVKEKCKRKNKSPLFRTEIRKLKEHFHSINHAVLSHTPSLMIAEAGEEEAKKAKNVRMKIGNFGPTFELTINHNYRFRSWLSFRDRWAWLDPCDAHSNRNLIPICHLDWVEWKLRFYRKC